MREILGSQSVSLELHLGYVTNGRESELSVVLREALWAYIEYKRIHPNPRLGAMTIIPLTPPLKCNVNTMTLHLKSGTKYMS